jgi:hypothetical protein
MEYPYNDTLMTYNELTGRYVLTEFALTSNGTYLRQRLSYNKTIDATGVINRVLFRVSEMIYGYIHTFNNENKTQDELIAKVPSLRNIIYQAMLCQAEYYIARGDLSRSPDANLRKLAIDVSAKEILNSTVQELGVPITFAGGFRCGFH